MGMQNIVVGYELTKLAEQIERVYRVDVSEVVTIEPKTSLAITWDGVKRMDDVRRSLLILAGAFGYPPPEPAAIEDLIAAGERAGYKPHREAGGWVHPDRPAVVWFPVLGQMAPEKPKP